MIFQPLIQYTLTHYYVPPSLVMKEHHHPHVTPTGRKRAVPPPKLKLLVCFNGAFSRSPRSQKFRYSGGETRIISVDPGVGFSKLKSKIIGDVVRAPDGAVSRFSLKYHVSESFCFGDGKDGPLLISLETDDDVRNMVEECAEAENLRKRVWVYVLDSHRRVEECSGNQGGQGFRWVEGFLREDLVALLRRKGGGNRSKKSGDDCLRKTLLRQQLLAKKYDGNLDEQMEIELPAGGGDGDCGAPLADSSSEKSLNIWRDYSQSHISPVKQSHIAPLNSKDGSLIKGELEPRSFESPNNPRGGESGDNIAKTKTLSEMDHQGANLSCNKGLENDQDHKQNIQPVKIGTMTSCFKPGFNLATGELQSIKNSDLEFIKELGSGTFGTVYHGKWKGSDVAIKQIKSSCFTDNAKEVDRLVVDFWKEAHMLGQLRHPNIVAIYGVSSDGAPNSLAAVTEYMVNGSLKKILRRKDGTIDRRKRLILAMDATSGMEYLHEKNVIHFDLKSDNFLVNMKDPLRPVCKIGDLGLSKVKERSCVSGGVIGTLPWMAPELLNGDSKVSEKVDVYSFGIVMWELLTGEVPYKHMRSEEVIGGIVRGDLRPEVPGWCDPAWRSLMERCWSAEPESRPPFSEIAKELRAMADAMKIK